jgi:hypothetical protein
MLTHKQLSSEGILCAKIYIFLQGDPLKSTDLSLTQFEIIKRFLIDLH